MLASQRLWEVMSTNEKLDSLRSDQQEILRIAQEDNERLKRLERRLIKIDDRMEIMDKKINGIQETATEIQKDMGDLA